MRHWIAVLSCIASAIAIAGPATQLRAPDPEYPTMPRALPVQIGSATSSGLSVTALDDAGNPVPRATVTFSVLGECGTFAGAQSVDVIADGNGVATSPPFADGATGGECDVVASPPGGVPVVIRMLGYANSQLVALSGFSRMVVATDSDFEVSFALQVQQQFGVATPLASTPVNISVGSTDGATATVVGSSAVNTGANGVATVKLHANGTAGSFPVLMQAAGKSASTTVIHVAPLQSRLVLTFANPSMSVSANQSYELAVDVKDGTGRSYSGIPVHLEINCIDPLACVETGDSGFSTLSANTDSNGRAHFPAIAGTYTSTYRARATGFTGSLEGYATVSTTNPDPYTYQHYQDMWWSGPAENGWGMSIIQHGLSLFTVIFAYDAQGKSTWFVLPQGSWNAAGNAWTGDLYRPHSSPWLPYDVSKFVPGSPVGSATITFSGLQSARLDYTIDGQIGTKTITREPFGAATGVSGALGDMWWAGSNENGWGIAIIEQSPKIFPIVYAYDNNGAPTWYVVPSGLWIANGVFQGGLVATTGSPWVGHAYDPTALHASDAGFFQLKVTGASTIDLGVGMGNISLSGQIVRQPF